MHVSARFVGWRTYVHIVFALRFLQTYFEASVLYAVWVLGHSGLGTAKTGFATRVHGAVVRAARGQVEPSG